MNDSLPNHRQANDDLRIDFAHPTSSIATEHGHRDTGCWVLEQNQPSETIKWQFRLLGVFQEKNQAERTMRDLAAPKDLSPDGKEARDIILGVLAKLGSCYTGGGTSFYTYAGWRAKGEDYGGPKAVLIVTHDGGELAPCFNSSYEARRSLQAMAKALERGGFYAEPMTCWATAIYKVEKCPKRRSTDVEQRHHNGNFHAPECDYMECGSCNHQWGHS